MVFSLKIVTWFFCAFSLSAAVVWGQSRPPVSHSSDDTDLRRLLGQRLIITVDYPNLSSDQEKFIRNGWAGGVVLYDNDIKSPALTRKYISGLQSLSPIPLLICIDLEGGKIQRLSELKGYKSFSTQAALGREGDVQKAYQFGVELGIELKSIGVNLNFAPVVDLDDQARDSIIALYERSLGSNPVTVANLAVQIVRGMRSEEVIAVAKHFPGETLARTDPHVEDAVSDVSFEQIEKKDLYPYRILIADGLDAVMISHVICKSIDPKLPTSLSSKAIQGLLRQKMGFQGLVISDAIGMQAASGQRDEGTAAVLAAKAGTDMIIDSNDHQKALLDALVAAAEKGILTPDSIQESYDRILRIKTKYNLVRP